jgi:hypothetical protein
MQRTPWGYLTVNMSLKSTTVVQRTTVNVGKYRTNFVSVHTYNLERLLECGYRLDWNALLVRGGSSLLVTTAIAR